MTDWYKKFLLDKTKEGDEETVPWWQRYDPFTRGGMASREALQKYGGGTDVTTQKKPLFKPELSEAERYKEYEALPFAEKLLYEAPLWGLSMTPQFSGTALWSAAGKIPAAVSKLGFLGKSAGAIGQTAKVAARIPVAPFYGIERGLEAGIRLAGKGLGAILGGTKRGVGGALDVIESRTAAGAIRQEAKQVTKESVVGLKSGVEFLKQGEQAFEAAAAKGKLNPFVPKNAPLEKQVLAELKATAKGTKPVTRLSGEEIADARKLGLIVKRIPAYKGEPAKLNVWAAYKNNPAGREAFAKLSGTVEKIESGALDNVSKHVELGRAFGYSDDDIARYLKETYGSYNEVVKEVAKYKPIVAGAVEAQPLAAEGSVAVDKVKGLIKSSKEQWVPTLQERKVEAGIRAGKLAGQLEVGQGDEAFIKGLSKIKGKMPVKQPIGNALAKEEKDQLANMIIDAHRSGDLRPFEALNAWKGLQKVYQAQLPQVSEMYQMERVFGQDFIKEILKKRAFWKQAKDYVLDWVLLPRTLLASCDFSAPLRQGLYLLPSHPAKGFTAFGKSVRMFFDPEYYTETVRHLASRPYATMAEDSGLFLGSLARTSKGISAREEAFMTRIAEKLPIIGKLVKASERAYVGYLDMFRASVFDGTVAGWGIKPTVKLTGKAAQAAAKQVGRGLDDITKLARYVNWATGRGWAPKHTDILNAVFFSPRLQTSRIGLPFLITKMLISDSPALKKMAARDLITFAGAAGTALGLAAMGGAEVELDNRSADFLKIKTGNTRLDIMGGFGQYMVLLSRMLSGERVSASGREIKVDRQELMINFLRTKGSPIVNMVWNLVTGKTFLGEEVKLDVESTARDLRDNLVPMFFQDVWDAAEDEGWTGALKALPGAFGVGVQTYDSAPQVVGEVRYFYSQRQLANQELAAMQRRKEFDKIPQYMQDHPELIYGQVVSGAYSQIERLEQHKKNIQDDPDIPDDTKDEMLKEIELQQIEIAVPALLAVDEIKWRRELEKGGIKVPLEGQPAETKSAFEKIKESPQYKMAK